VRRDGDRFALEGEGMPESAGVEAAVAGLVVLMPVRRRLARILRRRQVT
jgi:hypothetical protein